MKAHYTERLLKSYAEAPARIQRACDKQLKLLLANLRHPSLRAKKYDPSGDIWQARVNGGWRFYFTVEGDTYHLIDIIPHPK
jgi:mRNA-degrading endonuclease RelE of RelBE toxin-antitoxin system